MPVSARTAARRSPAPPRESDLPDPALSPDPAPAAPEPACRRLVIVTGVSGSGKSAALRVFEDLGYYCVDNLPPALLPQLADLGNGKTANIACVVDIRAGSGLDALEPSLEALDQRSVNTTILFLECSDPILINRFKETRRKHPLHHENAEGGILPSIHRERELLTELKARAHKVIDTSDHTPRSLAQLLQELFEPHSGPQAGLVITLLSFGFKHGLPLDADLVFDVRFLANPHYVRELRWQDGQQTSVVEFIRRDPLTQPFLNRLFELVQFSIPPYIQEGKAYLTIAIGCTGGRHRSVMVTEEMAEFLRGKGYQPLIQHRDIKR